ncbi:amino acid permease [Rhodococcus koreensis]
MEGAQGGSASSNQLKTILKQRQLSMISLGGVIGAALFVGSSAIINQAGPLTFVTYGLAGLLILLVMRMLGEMAAAKPSSGSFTDYARLAMGNWAGFSTGWLYWYFWVIIVGFEAVVGGQIIHKWIDMLPVWLIALGLLMVMTGLNLLSVSNFGEVEYWFASIKVYVIIAFIIAATVYVLGLWPGRGPDGPDFSNLHAHGGFTPHGAAALLAGVVLVITSMTGAEVVTIAAAESNEPARAIGRAVNSVVFRVLAFFVVSTFLIVVVVPWDQIVPGYSPFVTALEVMGFPIAARFLDVIILVTVLSVLNTGLYTSSRVLLGLGRSGDAPRFMVGINQRGVPARGVLSCTAVACVCVFLAALFPDTIFVFLLNAAGAITLFVYLMICVSELILRRRWQKESPDLLRFKMWLYPVLPILATLAIIGILVMMGIRPGNRIELLQGIAVWAALSGIYFVKNRSFKAHRALDPENCQKQTRRPPVDSPTDQSTAPLGSGPTG